MKKIKLTQGKYALVDDEDYTYLSMFKWYASKSGQTFYARRHKVVNGKKLTIRMHNEILGFQEGKEIDHINRNGLNNQRKNLRFVTHQENLRNKTKKGSGFSGVIGIDWKEAIKKWQVRFYYYKKIYYIGVFKDLKDAKKELSRFKRKFIRDLAGGWTPGE